MRGVMFGGKPYKPNGKLLPVLSLSKKIIGKITSGIFSPRIKKNIGLSMISKDYWKENQKVLVETLDGKLVKGTITSLPFPK